MGLYALGLTPNPHPYNVASMSRSIHQYVIDVLDPMTGSDLKKVEAATKIKASTLQKIRKRYIKNPGVIGIEKLYFHFKDTEGKRLRRRA
jgi:hypothetical protein